MFWRDKQWYLQHQSDACFPPIFQVHQKQMWAGPMLNISDGHRTLQDDWVVNRVPVTQLTSFDANGALWTEDLPGFKRRWHGGNNWSLGRPTTLLGDPVSLRSQSINQHLFHVVDEAGKPYNINPMSLDRPLLQVADLNGQKEMLLNGVFRKISSLAIDGEGAPWVMGRLMDTPNTDVFSGPFKYSEGSWQRKAVDIQFSSKRRLMSGRDGAISIGGKTQSGKAVVATWVGDHWQLVELPVLGTSTVAFTDSRGKVWAQVKRDIYYQQGALPWHSENSLTLTPVPLEKLIESAPKPKKIENSNLNEAGNSVVYPVKKAKTPIKVVPPKVLKIPKVASVQAPISQRPPPKPDPKPKAPIAEPNSSLVGCWHWSNNLTITINANGKASTGFGLGTWTGNPDKKFKIEWPSYTGTVVLSSDGQKLNSVDSIGVKSTAQRRQGSPNSFVGSWQWDHGGMVAVAADGSISLGSLRGTWQGGGSNYTVDWPIVDDVTVSEDGKKLSGKNQFGAFTATKQANCN